MKPGISRVLRISLLSAILAQAALFSAAAGEVETIQQEKEAVVANPEDAAPEFEEEIVQDGICYTLTDVVNTVVAENHKIRDPGKSLVITSAPFKKGEDYEKPAPTYENPEDGLTYELEGYEVVETMLEARTKPVEKECVFESVEQVAGIPQTYKVEVYDDVLKESITLEIPLSEYAYDNYRWDDDFEFQIQFHEYDADYYAIGDTLIPKDDIKPAVQGCEKELLNLIGASDEFYRIEDVSWSSDPFYDSNGVVCRMARATGQKLIATCNAVYRGTARLREAEANAVEAVYILSEEEANTAEYTVRSVATYTAQGKSKTGWDYFWDLLLKFLTSHEGIISIALLLLLLIVIVILEILKKRRRKNDTEKETGFRLR